jgi:hypothetical protein
MRLFGSIFFATRDGITYGMALLLFSFKISTIIRAVFDSVLSSVFSNKLLTFDSTVLLTCRNLSLRDYDLIKTTFAGYNFGLGLLVYEKSF